MFCFACVGQCRCWRSCVVPLVVASLWRLHVHARVPTRTCAHTCMRAMCTCIHGTRTCGRVHAHVGLLGACFLARVLKCGVGAKTAVVYSSFRGGPQLRGCHVHTHRHAQTQLPACVRVRPPASACAWASVLEREGAYDMLGCCGGSQATKAAASRVATRPSGTNGNTLLRWALYAGLLLPAARQALP